MPKYFPVKQYYIENIQLTNKGRLMATPYYSTQL